MRFARSTCECVLRGRAVGAAGAPGPGRWANPGTLAMMRVSGAQSPGVAHGGFTASESDAVAPAVVCPGLLKGFPEPMGVCPPSPFQPPPSPAPHSAPAAHHRTLARAGPAAWGPFPLLLTPLISAESVSPRDRLPELVSGDFPRTWEAGCDMTCLPTWPGQRSCAVSPSPGRCVVYRSGGWCHRFSAGPQKSGCAQSRPRPQEQVPGSS